MATVVNQYFLIEPNWLAGVNFRKKWNTSYQRSINNETLKRSALFTWPRRVLSFKVDAMNYAQASWIKRAIYKNLENVWGVPMWQDLAPLTADALSGQAVLDCDTTNRNFEVGGECIIYKSKSIYFIGTILSKTDSSITLTGNLSSTWDSGVSVYPILKARIPKTQNIQYETDQFSSISIMAEEEFDEVTRNVPSISGFPMHKGDPVFNIRPDWGQPIEESQVHNYEMLKFLGATQFWDQWNNADFKYKGLYYGNNKEDIQNIIDFFDYHKGRWGGFWRPSWFTDIKMISAQSAGDVLIEIEDIEFSSYWEGENAAQWLMIVYPDNTYDFRAVKDVPDANHITLHRGLGQDISADEAPLVMISFLSYCVFNQDEMEAQYITNAKADISLNFRTLLSETPAFTTTTTTSTTTSTSTSSSSSTTSSTMSSTSTTSTTATFTTTTGVSTTSTTIWLGTWANRRELTIDNSKIDSDQDHFPVAISLTENSGTPNLSPSDDFVGVDGLPPNPERWEETWPPAVISNNQLYIDADGQASGVTSEYEIEGDFDIQMDFALDAAPSTANWAVTLRVVCDRISNNRFNVTRRYDGTQRYSSYKTDAGVDGSSTYANSTDTSGKLRIVRTGTSFTGYYWNGSSWTALGTDTLSLLDDCPVEVKLYITSWSTYPQITGTLDNFLVNSGDIHWKETKGGRTDLSDIFTALSYPVPQSGFFDGQDGSWTPRDWTTYDTSAAGTIELLNNNLLLTLPVSAADEYLRLRSHFFMKGDFEVEIGYDEISNDPPSSSFSYPLSLGIRMKGGSLIRIGTRYSSTTQASFFNSTLESLTAGTEFYATGKFKISRVGSVITAWQWDGTDWTWNGSTAGKVFSDTDTTDALIELYSQADFNSGLESEYSNLKIEADEYEWAAEHHPNRRKMAVTKDDQITQIFGLIESFDEYLGKGMLWVSKHDLTILSASETKLYLYYDADQPANDNYIGDAASETEVTNITGDDFTGDNGDPPNPDLWEPHVQLWQNTTWNLDTDITIQGNLLRMEQDTYSASASYAILPGLFKLRGDFDIQIDVDVSDWVNSTATSKEANMYAWVNEANRASWRFDSDTGYDYNVSVANVWAGATTQARTNDYGGLRLIRTGTSLEAQYKDGAGAWTTIATETWIEDDCFVVLFARFDEEPFYTDFDNFVINSGTVVVNPGSHVWDQNYREVQLMNKNPVNYDSIFYDSSKWHHDGANVNLLGEDLIDGLAGGKALSLNGTNQCISIPQMDWAEFGGIDDLISFCGVAYMADWTTTLGDKKILSCTQTGGYSIDFDSSPDDIDGTCYITGAYRTTSPGFLHAKLAPGYHLLYVTYDGVGTRFYVDDLGEVAFNAIAAGTILLNATAPLLFGAEPDASGPTGSYFQGNLAFGSVSWKAKTADFIKAFYHSIFNNLLTVGEKQTTWLEGYRNRVEIEIDNTNIDSDLEHFPVPIVLGTSVGQTAKDISAVFDELAYPLTGDNFDGIDDNAPNPDLWQLNEIPHSLISKTFDYTVEIISDRLRYTPSGTSSANAGVITSKFLLSGDFDVQLGIEAGNAVDFGSLYLYENKSGGVAYRCGRELTKLVAGLTIQNTVTWPSSTISVRITRVGNTFTGYYWDSGWVLLNTQVLALDSELLAVVYSRNVTSQLVYFDDFVINSGTIIWPNRTFPNRKKIAITKENKWEQLFAEIEWWDQANENAVLWASKDQLDILSASATKLYLYYDSGVQNNENYIGDTAEEKAVTNITGDAFDAEWGQAPDPALWNVTISDPDLVVRMYDDKLRLTIPVTADDENISILSNFKLSGDFDIQLDYNLVLVDKPSSSVSYPIDFRVNDGTVYASIQVYESLTFHRMGFNSTNTTSGFSAETAFDTGKLRITRVGAVWTVYYWDSVAEQWEWDGSTAGKVLTESSLLDVYIQIRSAGDFDGGGTTDIWDLTINSADEVKAIPSAGVWDENYRGVYHMAQDPNGDAADSILDSTGYAKHGTPAGTMTSADLIDADIGKAIEFDGTDDYIDLPTSISVIGTIDYTFEAIVKTAQTAKQIILNQRATGTANPSTLFSVESLGELHGELYNSGFQQEADSVATDLDDNTEHHVALVRDSTTSIRLYNNGAVDGIDSGGVAVPLTQVDFNIGRWTGGGDYFQGAMAAVLVSHIERAAAWLKTFNNARKDNLLTLADPAEGEWLGTWAKRIAINIDPTNLDEDLNHFPIPIVLGTEAGLNGQDISAVFDELSSALSGDDFTGNDDDPPNPDLWTLDGTQRDPYIKTNKLRNWIDVSSFDWQRAKATFTLTGDFDIQVDFDLISSPAHEDRYSGMSLYADSDTSLALIQRRYETAAGGEVYFYNQAVTGSWGAATNTTTSDTSGKLRFVRTGSTLVCYYWNGSSWTQHDSRTWSANDATVAFVAATNALASFTVDHDNFLINSGTVIWPINKNPKRKKIALTKKDGLSQIYGELELWDDSNEKAVIWASKSDLKLLADGGNKLYLYYDSAQSENTSYIGDVGDAPAFEVWADFYRWVCHFAQDPNGDVADAIKDSTRNANHGTPNGTMLTADLVDGLIGKAIALDGTDDWIDFGDISVIDRATECEIFFAGSIQTLATSTALIKKRAAGQQAFQLMTGAASSDELLFGVNDSSGSQDLIYQTTDFNSVADEDLIISVNWLGTIGGWKCYKGSTEITLALDTAGSPLNIGNTSERMGVGGRWNAGTPGQFCNMTVRESRLSTKAMTAGWIKFNKYALKDQTIIFGKEELI